LLNCFRSRDVFEKLKSLWRGESGSDESCAAGGGVFGVFATGPRHGFLGAELPGRAKGLMMGFGGVVEASFKSSLCPPTSFSATDVRVIRAHFIVVVACSDGGARRLRVVAPLGRREKTPQKKPPNTPTIKKKAHSAFNPPDARAVVSYSG